MIIEMLGPESILKVNWFILFQGVLFNLSILTLYTVAKVLWFCCLIRYSLCSVNFWAGVMKCTKKYYFFMMSAYKRSLTCPYAWCYTASILSLTPTNDPLPAIEFFIIKRCLKHTHMSYKINATSVYMKFLID